MEKLVYRYVCKTKEHSRRSLCRQRNIPGNSLDAAVIEQVKLLSTDSRAFLTLLEKNKRFRPANQEETGKSLRSFGISKPRQSKKFILWWIPLLSSATAPLPSM